MTDPITRPELEALAAAGKAWSLAGQDKPDLEEFMWAAGRDYASPLSPKDAALAADILEETIEGIGQTPLSVRLEGIIAQLRQDATHESGYPMRGDSQRPLLRWSDRDVRAMLAAGHASSTALSSLMERAQEKGYVRDTEREHDGLDDEECSLCGGKGWNAIPYIEEDPRRAAACCHCEGTGKVRP